MEKFNPLSISLLCLVLLMIQFGLNLDGPRLDTRIPRKMNNLPLCRMISIRLFGNDLQRLMGINYCFSNAVFPINSPVDPVRLGTKTATFVPFSAAVVLFHTLVVQTNQTLWATFQSVTQSAPMWIEAADRNRDLLWKAAARGLI